MDEIGDMPLELQSKILRVLQEHEFERLGSTYTRRVDVRVVAATNQNLSALVANRQFRMDLYYRLNVFPIAVPPLRRRMEDVPILAAHFVRAFGARMAKEISKISPQAACGVAMAVSFSLLRANCVLTLSPFTIARRFSAAAGRTPSVSSRARATSVFPTPVGPRNRKDPAGRLGDFAVQTTRLPASFPPGCAPLLPGSP